MVIANEKAEERYTPAASKELLFLPVETEVMFN